VVREVGIYGYTLVVKSLIYGGRLEMKIKWLGHSSFLITSDKGIKIITDPYATGGGINYAKIEEAADIVTVSHQHSDHNNVAQVKGNPKVVKDTGKKGVKGIEFVGVSSYHDDAQGKQRGPNTIFCFAIDGIRICHLGDLGHELDARQIGQLGVVDVLFLPVGGFFTIDAKVAGQISYRLAPKVTIPMHYKTSKCTYPIADVEGFLKGKQNIRRLNSAEVEFKKEQLPPETQIVVLKHEK
jgi:L-ascorbate metabolism protein UlaG (beta-lactamase superfamily)